MRNGVYCLQNVGKNSVVPTLGTLRQDQTIFSTFRTQSTPNFSSSSCSGRVCNFVFREIKKILFHGHPNFRFNFQHSGHIQLSMFFIIPVLSRMGLKIQARDLERHRWASLIETFTLCYHTQEDLSSNRPPDWAYSSRAQTSSKASLARSLICMIYSKVYRIL
jgi:hypothetical protein